MATGVRNYLTFSGDGFGTTTTVVCLLKWMPEGAWIAAGGLIYFDPACHSNRNYVSSILPAPRVLKTPKSTRNGQFSADQNGFPLTGGP